MSELLDASGNLIETAQQPEQPEQPESKENPEAEPEMNEVPEVVSPAQAEGSQSAPEEGPGAPPREEPRPPPKLKSGYLMGIQDNEEFIFQVLGTDPGLVQLMGLHEMAGHHLRLTRDVNQGTGVPVVAAQMQQIMQLMKMLANMLTQQSRAIADLQRQIAGN
jgi:hypothetical protein